MGTSVATARDFADSLPKEYRERFSDFAIGAHAAIALARGALPANAGVFDEPQDPYPHGMCIVAEDRPGMLGLFSYALRANGFDVVDADAYTRSVPGGPDEAVDLFWLRRQVAPDSPPTEQDARRVRDLLNDMIASGATAPVPTERPSSDVGTRVRFLEGADGTLCTLELETADAAGLLGLITSVLFAERVQITRSEVRTRNGMVHDRFSITELDGESISAARRLGIQVAVISALDRGRS